MNTKMQLNTKNVVRIVLAIPTLMYAVYSIYYFIVNPLKPTYTDCGILRSKSGQEISIKHGSQTQLYMNIDFKESGFKSVEINPTTYFKYKVGDTVCLKLDKYIKYDFLFSFSGMLFISVLGIFFLWWLIMYLFTDY